MKALVQVPVKTDYFSLKGGLNLTTPPIAMAPGYAISATNFECDINGGYARIPGYERYDGQPAPSDAAFYLIPCSAIGTWSIGDAVSGDISGATGVYIGQSASGIFITKLVGVFQAENLSGGTGTTTATGDASSGGADTLADAATFRNLAADQYRADILEVPGSGPIRGIVRLGDVDYAFRNNAGGTACAMYKSSASGWVAVALGNELAFTSGGTYEIVEGNVITGAISGATATITRVVLESGSFAAGTAAGRLIFASQTGTFQAEDLDVGANPNVATIAGDSAAITLAPNGRYEFDIHNFGGGFGTRKIYGASGVHRGFEFDGSVFVPIDTGLGANDKPKHVVVHKEQLFFAFDASNQHSAPGAPYVFNAIFGAAELAVGDEVTGYMVQAGDVTTGALTILTRNKAFMLYGNDVSDWNLVVFQPDAGAIRYTAQHINGTLAQDDRGLTFIGTSQNYGNFSQNTISNLVQPFVRTQRLAAIASCISREKNQYRVFYSDGQAAYVTMDGAKLVGIMSIVFANPVACVWSGEANDGSEVILFGSTNGFVYQMERGTSFDGEPIDYSLLLAYNNLKSPQTIKRWRKLMLEINGDKYAEFSLGYQLGYNSSMLSQPATVTADVGNASAFWDQFIWDQFFWDGQSLVPKEFPLEGASDNIAIAISGSSDEYGPFTITGALMHYTPRTRIR